MRLKIKGNSILYHISKRLLTSDDKVQLVTSSFLNAIEQRIGGKVYQFVTLLKSLNTDDALYVDFFRNYAANNNLFESQLGQDCFVDTLLKKKANGTFVEIGVGNGVNLSNTFFLEKFRNWNGLLCEPAKRFHASIRQNRKSRLVESAVLNISNVSVDFVEVEGAAELSTVKNYVTMDNHSERKIIQYPVPAITFNDLCKDHLTGNHIDYLSIDTEGSEYDIIASISFDRFNISIISVEHNYDLKKLSLIRSVLLKNHYVEMFGFSWDSIFVKKQVLADY